MHIDNVTENGWKACHAPFVFWQGFGGGTYYSLPHDSIIEILTNWKNDADWFFLWGFLATAWSYTDIVLVQAQNSKEIVFLWETIRWCFIFETLFRIRRPGLLLQLVPIWLTKFQEERHASSSLRSPLHTSIHCQDGPKITSYSASETTTLNKKKGVRNTDNQMDPSQCGPICMSWFYWVPLYEH